MNKYLRLLMILGVVPLMAACAVTQQPVSLNQPIGPIPVVAAPARATSRGSLEVFTASKTYAVDDETYYRAHTDYGVYDTDGNRVMSVRNTASYHDPRPTIVHLPPGRYLIKGWADRFELVQVPVVIEPGRLTLVNLEAGQNKRFAGAPSDQLVHMADGRIIGWSARDM